MSKVAKVIGTIAGVVAFAALAVATFGASIGLSAALVATASSVATIAGLTATVAGFAGQMLTKPPPARGSVNQIIISPDAPQPYVIGEGPFAGVLRHDAAYGATLKKVRNPYRWMPVVYSGGGPVESITPWVDLAAVDSWYTGYLATDTQLGATPESTALVPPYGTAPGWDSTSKLSGQAAIGWNLKFDKDGKRFASGVPRLSAYGQWTKTYDPRLDSTFPGGSGTHRIDDETTWAWSENPALHAGTYAYGRHQSGKLTMGVGLPADGIDWVTIAGWANVCDANDWSIFGVCYEGGPAGDGVRWANLKDICIAGGAEPVFAGGLLSFKYAAPKVALDTITEADLADDDYSVGAMASWRERINTIIPKYRSPDHDWEMVQAEAVTVDTYVDDDGEVKQVEWAFNFVKEADQAAQLAAYRLVDAREIQPISLVCKPRLRAYRPGECLHVDIPSLGLDTPAVITQREFDPATMTVRLTLIGETAAKHAFALGQVAVPPPTPALGQTAQERDEVASSSEAPAGYDTSLISQSYTVDAVITGHDAGADASIIISDHDRVYSDKVVSVDGATLTGKAFATTYSLYYDDGDREGGAVTIIATTDNAESFASPDHPDRHNIGAVTTPADGAADTTGYPTLPPGWNFYVPIFF